MPNPQFPPPFLFGAATSAYQIEGSPLADGAGESNWHRFSHTPGRVHKNETGDVACDHYRRYKEDVALMRGLGLNAYRFSISWSRVFPEGKGGVNQRGLDFYQRLVDELLENGIRPNVTLYHWDLPAALDDRGGWLNRDIAGWFADYAATMFRALDDRVPMWATLNEPWVVADGGYMNGVLAPGHKSAREAAIVSHNLLRAHGAGVTAYRAIGRNQIGLVVNLEPKYPASDSRADLAATERADAYMNRYYLDPVFRGSYPEELPEMFGDAWPVIPIDDLAEIKAPIDFLGINYYKRALTKHDSSIPIEHAARVSDRNRTHTDLDWEVYPKGLTDVLVWAKERYGELPVYITENGAAFRDPEHASDSVVNDPLRVDYLREHLGAALDAIERGVDLRGYFVWSLLDNMEWAHGYSKRFGIVHVDFTTQKRTPKSSALFYSEVIHSGGPNL